MNEEHVLRLSQCIFHLVNLITMRPFYYAMFCLLLLFLLFQSCESYTADQCDIQQMKRREAFRRVRYSCEPQPEEYYFTGILNGKRICYYHGHNNYEARTSHWGRTHTTSNVLGPGTSILGAYKYLGFGIQPKLHHEVNRNLQPSLVIITPLVHADSSFRSIAKHYIVPGRLILRDHTIGETEGFDVVMEIPYRTDDMIPGNYIPVTAEASLGHQQNSRLEVVAWEYYQESGWDYYRITLDVECNLYGKDCYGKSSGLIYRLREGRLVMVVAAPDR